MEKKRTPIKQKNEPQRESWPWLQLEFVAGGQSITGKYQGKLSPHLLNLRATAAPTPKAEQLPASRPASAENIDFAHHDLRFESFVPVPLGDILKSYPNVARLSVVTCLDIVWSVLGTVFSLVAYSYLVIFYRLRPISRSVYGDLSNFVNYIGLVLFAPVRVFKRPAAGQPVREVGFIRYGFNSAAWFGLVALLVILPVKGIATLNEASARQSALLEAANQGALSLKTAGSLFADGDLTQAQMRFNEAAERFDAARSQLGNTSERFLKLMDSLPGVAAKFSSASRLLAASSELSQAAAKAAAAWETGRTSASPDSALAALEAATIEVQPHVREALAQLADVDPSILPENLRGQLTTLQGEIDQIEGGLTSAFELPMFLRSLAGGLQPRRYLLLFQNPNELRPNGGFAGSLAFVELHNGKVTDLQVPGGGPYDFQGNLKRVIRPPEPIRISRGTWQLQDAAWFFDFPTSARKVLWFLRESGSPEVDGVITVNADVAANLIGLTGDISLPKYNKVLTKDNFVRETQEAVEIEFDAEANRPKQFIADLAPTLLERVMALQGAQQFELVRLLDKSLSERSVQIYLTDPDLEAKVRSFGWAGEVKSAPLDYLAIVRANIGGGKTDAVTNDSVRYNVELLPSGDMIAQLNITRHHAGDPRDVFEWRRNQSYLRIYVPEGSQLISASGFTQPPAEHFHEVPVNAEIDDDLLRIEQAATQSDSTGVRITHEFGKTVFGHWLNVMPGEERTATLTYRLPFSLVGGGGMQDLRRYALYVQRQSGVRNIDFAATLKMPESWRVRWQESGSMLSQQPGLVTVQSDLMQDLSYGVLLERN